MYKNYIIPAAIFGGLAVVLGAFGAHVLERVISNARPDDLFGREKILHGFHTGVQYQMYHALALLALAIMVEKFQHKWIKWAANCFIAGIILFSGSLYLLTFLKIQESSAVKFVGPVTPLGGVFFIAGWLFLLLAAVKKK